MTSEQTEFRRGLTEDLGRFAARLPIAAFRTAVNGEMLWANQAMVDMFGLPDLPALLAMKAADLYADPVQREAIREQLEVGTVLRGLEVRLRRPSGALVWGRISSGPVYDDAGRVQYYEGVLEDVTTQHRARAELAGAGERFRRAFAAADSGMVLFDADQRVVRVNEQFAEMVGMTTEDLEGMDLSEIDVTAGSGDVARRLDALRLGQLMSYDVERTLRHANGRLVRVRSTISPFLDERGEVVAFSSQVNDITERQPDELSQATSDALMGTAFEMSPIGMVVTSADRTPARVNAAFCRMLGLTKEEALSTDTAEIMHPADYPAGMARKDDLLSGGVQSYSTERRLRHRDGHYLWTLLSVCALRGPDGDVSGILTQVVDVTERRRIEEALRDSEARFRSAFDEAPVGMLVTTLEYEKLSVNPALCRMLGYGEQELLALPVGAILGPQLIEGSLDRIRRTLAGETGLYPMERQLYRKDGGAIWVLASVNAVRGADGKAATVLIQIVDISEVHEAREALEQSEAENLALLDSIPDLMFRLDRQGTILACRAGRTLGPAMAPETFLGKSIAEIHPPIADDTMAAIDAVLGTGEAETIEYEMEIDGQQRMFEARFSWMSAEQVVSIIRDITDRKRVEEQLQALVRSKDEFVAAVSHELRTPLTTVVGLASELRDRGNDFSPEERSEFVRLIADQSREMAELVDDLLAAAQADVGLLDVELMFVDLAREASEVAAVWPEGKVHIKAENQVIVLADPFRVRQVVRNLVTNAVRYGGDTIEILVGADGDVGSLRVCDNGGGIPEDQWELVFDPYFRAHHREGQPASLGLGLTIGRMLAWLMNGELDYVYADGWSVFELSLPIPGGPPPAE